MYISIDIKNNICYSFYVIKESIEMRRHMNEIQILDKIKIEDYIYEIRGKHVMLDSDLAELYKCKNGTKEINQAVKNNIDKFPERFSWVLTEEEWISLRSKILTLDNQGKGKHRKYLPRVFTEEGVAMLATILHTKIASKISIAIMDAFVTMRKFISTNLLEQKYVNNLVMEHDYDIKLLKESFSKLEEKKKTNEIYYNGQIYDAYYKILEIFKSAKKKLIVIDSYSDNNLLNIIKRLNIDVVVITRKNNLLTKDDIDKYNKQYNNLKVIYNNTFHDRYFILDNKYLYHCGASINRIGYKTFSITLVGDSDICNSLINKVNEII